VAISATFLADFNQYNAAVTGAEGHLRALEGTAAKVGTTTATTGATSASSFSTMASSAMSLAATLGVAFSVGAVVNFGRELLTTADALVRIHDRTGLTISDVQRLSFVADQSGNSIDELTSAIGQMQNRLASGDKSAVQAVKELGINFQTLISASPAEQMGLIAEAIGKIPDPATRTAIAMDLFGKSGTAILPTLTSQFNELAAAAPLMEESTVRALDRAGDALSRFWLGIKVGGSEAIGKLIDVGSAFEKFAFWAAGMHAPVEKFNIDSAMLSEKQSLLSDTVHKTAEELAAEKSALEKAQKATADAATAMERLTKAAQDHINSISDRLFGNDDIKRAEDYVTAVGRIENVTTMTSAAQKEFADTLWKAEEALVAQGLAGSDLMNTIEQYRLAATQTARDAAAGFQTIPPAMKEIASSTEEATGVVAQFRSVAEAAAQSVTLSWSQAMSAVRAGLGTMSGTIQGVAAGTPGSSTRYDDYNNPYTYLPGFNAPGKTSPAGSSIFVDARESFFDSPAGVQRLADKVVTALGTRATSQGRA